MFKLKNSVYDWLKWIAIVVIPCLGEAYVRLAEIWNLPYAQQINETALVVTFILGALLGISTIGYNKNQATISDFTNVSDTLDTFEDFKEGDDVK